MADSTGYAASGGWSGGSPLSSTGGLLSNYYNKLQNIDPNSGSLVTAQSAQPATQPASLSRVATTTQAVPTIAAQSASSTQPTATDPTQAAAHAAAQATASAVAPATMSRFSASISPGATQTATGATHTTAGSGSLQSAAEQASNAGVVTPMYAGPASVTTGDPSNPSWTSVVNLTFDAAHGGYVLDPASTLAQLQKMFPMLNAQQAMSSPQFQTLVGQKISQANSEYAPQISAFAQAQTAAQTTRDKNAQALAQDTAAQSTAFNLAGALQAPNTDAIDQASANKMAQVQSMYSSGLGGVDAGAYNSAAQQAQATQAAVNKASHDTAYANAFNQNYSTFANALAAQQSADVNATGQKLQYDIQGVGDAVSQLEAASNQLTQGTKTKFETALIPLKQNLANYQLAVKQYGASSQQATALAQSILSGASSLTAALV